MTTSGKTGVRKRPGMRIGTRILIVFFLFSSVISFLVTFVSYQVQSRKAFRTLEDRLRVTAEMASLVIDRSALKSLKTNLGDTNFSPERVGRIENSTNFRKVFSEVSNIRGMQSDLILWTYIFSPETNTSTWRYLADIPDPGATNRAGMNHFGKAEDVSEWTVMIDAAKRKAVRVDDKISHDEETGKWTVGGYAPILDADGSVIGLIGIDVEASTVRSILNDSLRFFGMILLSSFLLALLVSLLFSAAITRPIRLLNGAVNRFREKDFGARAEVRSGDEVGELVASFNDMAGVIQEYNSHLLQLNAAYERFVPVEFLRFLSKKSVIDIRLGDQTQREMTILFADIRSFTKLSESMSPKENFDFLNSFLFVLGPVVRQFGGFIDKYMGDAIMALFPEKPEDGLRAAIEMQRQLDIFNAGREAKSLPAIRVGIRLNCGTLMLGAIGEERRMDGTVISDAVNVASRLEGLTKLYKAKIIVGRSVADRLEHPAEFGLRFLGRAKVKGKSGHIDVLESFDADPDGIRAIKRRSAADFEKAVGLFHDRRFEEAYGLFAELAAGNPGDEASAAYLGECMRLLNAGK